MKWKWPILVVPGFVLWGGAVAWGFSQGMKFEATPGQQAVGFPVKIDQASSWRIVLVASTECPCTAASVSGLKAASDSYPGSTVCEVVFVGKPDKGSRAYRLAANIKGGMIVVDTDGAVKRRFGAATSGQTFIYSPDGRLAYHGGLTAGRGVDDPRFAIELYKTVRGQGATPSSPAYGCSLEVKPK